MLFRSVSKIGDVTVRIPSDINYKGADFSLLLDAGDLICFVIFKIILNTSNTNNILF